MHAKSPIPSGWRDGAPPALDLLVIGGLTVDHFADAAATAGGAALHATRAAAEIGLRAGVVTHLGPEPEAQRGLEALSRLASVHAEPVPATIAFEHVIADERRPLVLRHRGAELPGSVPESGGTAVLYAPVAAEVRADHLRPAPPGSVAGAVLQGWLRWLEAGRPVRPLPLAALDGALVSRLSELDLVCASVEDLVAEVSQEPRQLLATLRLTLGDRPILALTDGSRGAWVDDGVEARRIAPPRVVRDVDTTGAGDAFAAVMLAMLDAGEDAFRAAEIAADETARFLRRRLVRRVAVGDVHGHRERLEGLLAAAGLVDLAGRWTAGNAELWFLGDLTDRGPDGVGVIDLVRRLQVEAEAAGGRVECLLGNHEVLLLAAHRMPEAPAGGPGGTFRGDWLANGGRPDDLARVTPEIAAWLRSRPAMARVDGDLLVHADSAAYASMGAGVTEVNAVVAGVLATPRPRAWDRLLEDLSRRMAFSDPGALDAFLRHFGVTRVVHGHTPVPILLDGDPDLADRPHRYASGRAIAVDPGLYLGGPGFVVEL
jgi:sugar/nucleoside kinase (ribokinase family)